MARRMECQTHPRCRFAPSLSSVKRILWRFRDRGDYKTHYGGSRRRPALMATAHVAFLIDYLDSIDSTLFLDEMSELLKRQFNVVYKQRRICATLLRRGYTRRKLTINAIARSKVERATFVELVMKKYRANQFVFIATTRV